MFRRLIALLTLLPAVALADISTSGSFISTVTTCSPVCALQDFATDPFTGSPSWTVVHATAQNQPETDCSWFWGDGEEVSLLKTTSGTCNAMGSFSYVRFNGEIAEDGCASVQVTANTDGHWGVALMPRDESPKEGNINTEWPTAALISCDDETCANLSLQRQHEVFAQNCAASMAAVGVGDYIGACISGDTVTVFNLSDPPGDPATTAGGGGWGDPECTFDITAESGPISSELGQPGVAGGKKWGISAYGGTTQEADVFSFDNFRVYSCQGL